MCVCMCVYVCGVCVGVSVGVWTREKEGEQTDSRRERKCSREGGRVKERGKTR